MQLDFHHAATYGVARLGGLGAPEAATVAYASQYVDDATNEGVIQFTNGARYERICSAHKMLDYRNFAALANSRVWVPFHFLPGNGGLPADQSPPGRFVYKLICRPDSPVARDMLRACHQARHKPYALHRLGITLHVFVDTWAHQGFVGINHEANDAEDVHDEHGQVDLAFFEKIKSYFVGEAWPLGHGAVLSKPDLPYLIWGYRDGLGQKVLRDNPSDYMTAIRRMHAEVQRYCAGDPDLDTQPLRPQDARALEGLIREVRDPDERVRHQRWLKAIADGAFSFGAEQVDYVAKGVGSWKHRALGTAAEKDDEDATYVFSDGFLSSDWKRFHDALQMHRLEVIGDILPRYGICMF